MSKTIRQRLNEWMSIKNQQLRGEAAVRDRLKGEAIERDIEIMQDRLERSHWATGAGEVGAEFRREVARWTSRINA